MVPGKAPLKAASWLSSNLCKHLDCCVPSCLHWYIAFFLVGGLVLQAI